MSCLVETWVSRASADQRRGRAGRVRPGVCFRMFPRYYLDKLDPHTIPEMHRVALDSLCLQVKLLKLGSIVDFLSKVHNHAPCVSA